MTSTAQVIPFRFESHEVRTLLIDDQPWFVASDVSSALEYRDADKLARLLDDDEKGTQIVGTLGGEQKMLVINESGLYSAILRSRKAEAKRFKKWVTAEVLPAIRKHGRYEDAGGKMDTLLGQTIGTDGFHVLGAIIKGKVVSLPQAVQRRATAKIWSQTHAAFGVRSAADIPADQLDAARNFIAAYALEGEWLRKEPEPKTEPRLDIHFPVDYLSGRRPGTQYHRNEHTDFLEVFPLDLVDPAESPCELILTRLTKAGYNVAAAWWEVRTYRNKLAQMHRAIESLKRSFEAPQQYVIAKPDLI
ncbi:BRO-N domain-containing protein [Azotobacter salinestris]|uniref:BRO-N domain-containing protein n=1 Tax=Azotobacter salinestris TaxID=69964 RepID=UPI0032DF84B4